MQNNANNKRTNKYTKLAKKNEQESERGKREEFQQTKITKKHEQIEI